MVNMIFKLILLVVILVGVILVYDARVVTKKFFSFGDQNEATSGLKIIGFVIIVIGLFILRFLI